MGRRGPPPTPIAVRRAKGETNPSRVNFEEPQPTGELRMPRDLDPAAKVVWRRVTTAMRASGVLTAADRDILRIYCETVVRYERASAMLLKSTPLLSVSRRRGEVVRNPLNAVVRDLADLCVRLARELGLSPSARVSLRMDLSKQNLDLDALIGPPPSLRAVK